MALTGHLSDLSLSELIEFFCNQRKLGLLSVHYPRGSGAFYLQNGSVVDAKIGTLRGIDAVYYALTLPNAAFEFKGAAEPSERTINQPWTQVVLEGLRRLDEGIIPAEAFPDVPLGATEPVKEEPAAGQVAEPFVASDQVAESLVASDEVAEPSVPGHNETQAPPFLALINPRVANRRKPLIAGLAAAAVLVSVAVIGVPAGWYARGKAAAAASQPNKLSPANSQTAEAKRPANDPQPNSSAADLHANDATVLAAKRQREKDRARAREEKANASAADAENTSAAVAKASPATAGDSKGQKKVTVQVSYDDSGRVVQASGTDPTALRIARQKRFPAGKAGTATVTIPIN